METQKEEEATEDILTEGRFGMKRTNENGPAMQERAWGSEGSENERILFCH